MGSVTSSQLTRHHLLALTGIRICLDPPPTGLNRDVQHPDDLPFCVPPSLKRFPSGCRNINLLPIDYAFQPRLRGRLTQGRLTLPWKPWAYGEWVSHPFYRYSCQHRHFSVVHSASRLLLHPLGERSPTISEDRTQNTDDSLLPRPVQSIEHLGDLTIAVAPTRPCGCVNVTQVQAVANPHTHLFR